MSLSKANQTKPIRKMFTITFMNIAWKLIRPNLRLQFEWIRIGSDTDFWMIRSSSNSINPSPGCFKFMRIESLIRIEVSDGFRLIFKRLSTNAIVNFIHIVSYLDTDFAMIRNSSDLFEMNTKWIQKNLLASLAHSHRALRAQLASLARMSVPRARDLMVVALRAPTYVNFALRAQCCALRSA